MSYPRLIVGAIVLVLRTVVLGIVIRLRAQYIPKEVERTDSEKQNDEEILMTPCTMSFLDMLKRVITLEGWRGLLKGIVPMAIGDGVLLLTTAMIESGRVPLLLGALHPYLSIIYDVPLSIFIIRAVITTESLSFTDFRGTMRALLSPAERRKPWMLYLTPGLVSLVFFQVARTEVVISTLLVIDAYIPDRIIVSCVSTRRLAWLVLMLFHHLCTSPLEAMKVRLALQRKSSIPANEANGSSEDKVENDTEPHSIKLLHLRTDTDLPPYTAMFTCEQTIIKEEGYQTLFPGRAWWFTVLTNLLALYGGLKAAPFS